jgi:hypothetical protein
MAWRHIGAFRFPRTPETRCWLRALVSASVVCCTYRLDAAAWPPAGIVGYLTMLRPTGARSPYIIMAVNCVWVAVAAFIALKAEFR